MLSLQKKRRRISLNLFIDSNIIDLQLQVCDFLGFNFNDVLHRNSPKVDICNGGYELSD